MHPADTFAAYLAGIIVGAVATAATLAASAYSLNAITRVWRWLRGE